MKYNMERFLIKKLKKTFKLISMNIGFTFELSSNEKTCLKFVNLMKYAFTLILYFYEYNFKYVCVKYFNYQR